MAAEIEFEVNGEPRRVSGDAAMPLLLALRGTLNMRGTRHGCATGDCGACTVLINGQPTPACITPLAAVAGQRVETIEAFEVDAIGQSLFGAFISEQAGQCAYCLPGILIESKALLAKSPTPSRTEIAAALDGHLCRCGAHQRILNAVEKAAHDLAASGARA